MVTTPNHEADGGALSSAVDEQEDLFERRDHSIPWHRAATLAERLERGAPGHSDEALGRRRFEQWLRLPALATAGEEIDEALAPFGVTCGELVALLGETEASLAERLGEEPQWHRRFRELWADGRRAQPELPDDLQLLEFARPLIAGAVEALRRCGREVCSRIIDPEAAQLARTALGHLVRRPPFDDLTLAVGPTLVLELNVARMEGRLDGATPEERYASFVAQLQCHEVSAAILAEYPVLSRFLVERLDFWIERSLEVVQALADDLPELRRTFSDGLPLGSLVSVSFGAGDSHRRGRTVGMVTFETRTLVYKPRSSCIDRSFDRLLAWVNERGCTHQLRRIVQVTSEQRGWFEFVDTSVPTDDAGADRYAWRLGALTAVLHALEATDFHFENVLASGEDPVLVDLEALFHTDKHMSATGDGQNAAANVLARSVLAVGILPSRMVTRDASEAFALDVSAVAGRGGQLGLVPVPTFVEVGTDTMHVELRRNEVPAQRNNPTTTSGEVVDLATRGQHFRAGFAEVHRLLVSRKDGLTAPGGLLDAFGSGETRHIARPTFRYARLLMESLHPDFQRDALDRALCLGKLLGGHAEHPDRARFIRSEAAELIEGDVPLFRVGIDSGEILDGRDAHVGVREPTPLESVRRRVDALDAADLDLQLRIIDRSFAASVVDGEVSRWPTWSAPVAEVSARGEDLVEAARGVVDLLSESAVYDEERVGWIGLNLVDERWWTVAPAGLDLYAGLSGIALALSEVATVGRFTDVERLALRCHEQVAEAALALAAEFAESPGPPAIPGLTAGAFGLLGGPVYALAHGAVVHRRRDLAEAAAGLVAPLATLAAGKVDHDLVAGRAGAILALISLDRVLPGTEALSVAEDCAERLVEGARPIDDSLSWPSPFSDGQPLVGLSHGAVGVAIALARLYEVRPARHLLPVIEGALRYERRHRYPHTGNWRDLRGANRSRGTEMNAWCHGSAGGALARQGLLDAAVPLTGRDELAHDRDAALECVARTGLLGRSTMSGVGNHSICHGDVGNLLCVQTCVEGGAMALDADALPKAWATLVRHASERGWLCGVPEGLATPGLMTGLAGIAWGLVRAADPSRPNVLLLEEPVVEQGGVEWV